MKKSTLKYPGSLAGRCTANIKRGCCEQTGLVVEEVVLLRSVSDAEIGASVGTSSQDCSGAATAGPQLSHQASSAG